MLNNNLPSWMSMIDVNIISNSILVKPVYRPSLQALVLDNTAMRLVLVQCNRI